MQGRGLSPAAPINYLPAAVAGGQNWLLTSVASLSPRLLPKLATPVGGDMLTQGRIYSRPTRPGTLRSVCQCLLTIAVGLLILPAGAFAQMITVIGAGPGTIEGQVAALDFAQIIFRQEQNARK